MLLVQDSLSHTTQDVQNSACSHYTGCKSLSSSTTACVVVPGFPVSTLPPLLKGMSLIKTHSKGCTLFDAPTTSGMHLMQPGTCPSRSPSSTCETYQWQDSQTHVFPTACCLMLPHLKTKLVTYGKASGQICLGACAHAWLAHSPLKGLRFRPNPNPKP